MVRGRAGHGGPCAAEGHEASRRDAVVSVGPHRALTGVLEGVRSTAYGVTWLAGDFGDEPAVRHPASLIARVCALDVEFVFVDAGEPWADALCEELGRAGVEPAWAVPGPLSRAAGSLGWGLVMRESARDPDSLARRVQDGMPAVLEDIARGADLGARVFVLADELASSAGWLVDPTFVRSWLLPTYAPFVTSVRASGGHAMLHSDGDIVSLVSDVAELGFRAIHLGPGAATPDAVRAVRAAGVVPAGGVSVREALENPEQAVTASMSLASEGPMVLCDDGAIASTVELHAVARVLASLRGQQC